MQRPVASTSVLIRGAETSAGSMLRRRASRGTAAPMTFALRELGWTGAYLTTASLGVALSVALVVVVRDAPEARLLRGPRLSLTAVRRSLAASWAHPGTRLGFWMHFTTQFSATTFALLWGYPFLVQGEGLSEHAAGLLLVLWTVRGWGSVRRVPGTTREGHD